MAYGDFKNLPKRTTADKVLLIYKVLLLMFIVNMHGLLLWNTKKILKLLNLLKKTRWI